jgi:hypothetical protein
MMARFGSDRAERVLERRPFLNQIRFVSVRRHFPTRLARLRAFWHYIIRRHPWEICGDCGRPVTRSTGDTWWGPLTISGWRSTATSAGCCACRALLAGQRHCRCGCVGRRCAMRSVPGRQRPAVAGRHASGKLRDWPLGLAATGEDVICSAFCCRVAEDLRPLRSGPQVQIIEILASTAADEVVGRLPLVVLTNHVAFVVRAHQVSPLMIGYSTVSRFRREVRRKGPLNPMPKPQRRDPHGHALGCEQPRKPSVNPGGVWVCWCGGCEQPRIPWGVLCAFETQLRRTEPRFPRRTVAVL